MLPYLGNKALSLHLFHYSEVKITRTATTNKATSTTPDPRDPINYATSNHHHHHPPPSHTTTHHPAPPPPTTRHHHHLPPLPLLISIQDHHHPSTATHFHSYCLPMFTINCCTYQVKTIYPCNHTSSMNL